MKISDKTAKIILAIIIVISLAISTFFVYTKQGYHEDELLTYNLSNSQKQLSIDGGWNTPEDFNEYLTVSGNNRFNYGLVVENQITDASHPPFYYAIVHTICSFFPDVFSRYFAYSFNVTAIIGVMIFLYKIGKRVTNNNLYALTAAGSYALSIACFTTTIYLRMYATLTFFVTVFVYMMIRLYDKERIGIKDCFLLLPVITLGMLTQYYFILFAGLTGIVFLVFMLKDKRIKDLLSVIATAVAGIALSMLIYPHIIENILGGNRGFGSLSFNIDTVTIVTYVIYKLRTYFHILAKEMFLGQVWLLAICTVGTVAMWIYLRFIKKQKTNRKALFFVIPALVFFFGISLVSPFNSDRYVMASLPFISMAFTLAAIKALSLVKNNKARLIVPVGVVIFSAIALYLIKPYYIYGKTNLYEPKDKNCVFIGTAMLEWNKCIDKLMQYDGTMIVQTDKISPSLGAELEDFAQSRGVITNGKISSLANAYMNNGGEKNLTSSMEKIHSDKKLKTLDSVTVYISRLADQDYVLDCIKKNTPFKSSELIQKDYGFDEFFNWYDYFVETESYCNVYRLSKS